MTHFVLRGVYISYFTETLNAFYLGVFVKYSVYCDISACIFCKCGVVDFTSRRAVVAREITDRCPSKQIQIDTLS